MRHVKLWGIMSPMERMANVAASATQSAREATTRQSGTISVPNADGTRSILGPQAGSGEGAPGGQAIATHVGDTTPPPVPTGIKAWSGDGYLHISWDGTLEDAIPADFFCVNILVDGTAVSRMQNAGSVTVEGLEAGSTVSVTATSEDDACLADGTPVHNVSAPCTAISVTIRDMMAEVKADADAHGEQIEAVKKDIADYKDTAEATYATKTEVDSKTGAITKTLTADYTKTADLASTSAVKDAKAAGTAAQNALDAYKGTVSETYAEKTELTEAVNQLSSTMTSQYTAFTDYRTSNDKALSKAQSDATDTKSTIDSYKQSNDKAVADAKAAGTTAQNQLRAYKSSNDAAVKDAKKAGTDAQSQLVSYKTATDQRLDELKNIADNAIDSFYLKGAPTASNPPASSWTTDALKKQHAGDLYMDTDTGYSYRWSGTEWVQVKDSDVTKALKEIESVKTDYATKSELKATDTELSGKVSDALSTAKSYTDGSVEKEATARDAAIKAQADSISLSVSKTYTKQETFSAYQSDADGRIATANSNASTAVSTAKTAATDAATAKTNASTAVSTADAAKSTAQTASTNASDAVSTANSASSKSDRAVSTANSASSTANAAKSTVDGMQIGGRNLLLESNTPNRRHGSKSYPAAEYEIAKDGLILGEKYTWSVNGTFTGAESVDFYFNGGYYDTGWASIPGDGTHTITKTFTANADIVANDSRALIYVRDARDVPDFDGTAVINWAKLERGNKATDWTPAPEDTDSRIATAKSTADTAKSTADSAKTAAGNAQSTANTAVSNAAKAQSTADDAYSRTLRVQISSSPADATGDTSTLTATVWRGGQQLTEQEVAMMGLVKWYVGDSCKATGWTYTCAAGTAVQCRLEA